MLKKLKIEADTYGGAQKTILWLVLGVMLSWIYFRAFVEQYPDGGSAGSVGGIGGIAGTEPGLCL